MKVKEIKEKSEKELRNLLAENREKARRLKFDLASKKLKNPNEIRLVKKDIARILTFLRFRRRQSHGGSARLAGALSKRASGGKATEGKALLRQNASEGQA